MPPGAHPDPAIAASMRAVRLRRRGGPEALALEQIATPSPRVGEALVRVHAAAITRDELEWPVDRLPAIPSYELSGVVAALGQGVESVAIGEPVYALIGFDRDGAAADYTAVPAALLAPKPRTLGHLANVALLASQKLIEVDALALLQAKQEFSLGLQREVLEVEGFAWPDAHARELGAYLCLVRFRRCEL